MMMMEAFRSPSVVARCCRELEIADTLPSVHCQNQRPMSQVDGCDVQHVPKSISRMRREEPRGSSLVRSDATDHQITLKKLDTTTTTSTGVRSGVMDCHHHHHDQEERESTSLSRSILGCNSSSAADILCNDLGLRGNNVGTSSLAVADFLCNDFGLRGNNAGTSSLDTRSQNWNTTSVAAPEIESYNEADISAACLLLELSATSYSLGDKAGVEHSRKQPCSCTRVSDVSDHAAPALPPVRELSEPVRAKTSGRPRVPDDEAVGTVQETTPTWEATYSNTPRSLRIELKTLGKKRIKPRKDERELNVFRMNQEVLTPDNKYDILDRPTRKRHYKSLRVLLGIK